MDISKEYLTVNYQPITNGETIAYRKQTNPSALKNLILIHGAMCSSYEIFNDLFDLLKANSDLNIYAIDIRGSGYSTYNKKPSSFADISEDINLFITSINLKNVIVAGHSMGGLIALNFAGYYPNSLEKLITIGGVGVKGHALYYEEEDPITHEKTIKRCIKRKDVMKTPLGFSLICLQNKDAVGFSKMMEGACFIPEEKYSQDRILEICKEGVKQIGFRKFIKFVINSNLTNDIIEGVEGNGLASKIKCQTMVIHGDKDMMVPVFQGFDTYVELGEKCRLEVLKDCGHFPQMTYSQKTAALIEDFIKT